MEKYKILQKLKNAARTKHLFAPNSNPFSRAIRRFFKNQNKIEYFLGKSDPIPNEFIRQEPWEIEYLYTVARLAKKGILETGRFNGGSSLVFASANEAVPIYSIDIAPVNDQILLDLCKKLGIGGNIQSRVQI